MATPSTAPSQTYPATCHCGNIRFAVTLSPPLHGPSAESGVEQADGDGGEPAWSPYKVLNCNCSICTRAGYLLVYPNKQQVKWEEGCFEKTKKYKFHDGSIKEHLFCPECGTSLMIDFHDFWREDTIKAGKAKGEYDAGEKWEVLGVSARTFVGLDLDTLTYRKLDGINKVGVPGDTAGKWKDIVKNPDGDWKNHR